MKLRAEEIKKIAAHMLQQLKAGGHVTFRGAEAVVQSKIEAIITKNLQDEMAIEDQVKKLMDQYRQQIASGAIDSQKVYTMMKKQVAKERKFVL